MSTEYLLLGLLNRSALSGYDLHKQFGDLLEKGWDTDRRQVYYLLHKMEKNGWLDVEVIPQEDNPTKKVYHITESGQQALREWIRTPLGPSAIPFNWMGQLFLGYEVAVSDIVHILEDRCAYLQARIPDGQAGLDDLESSLADEADFSPERFYRLLSLHHGFTYTLSELRWAQQAVEWLRALDAEAVTPAQLAHLLIQSIRDMNSMEK